MESCSAKELLIILEAQPPCLSLIVLRTLGSQPAQMLCCGGYAMLGTTVLLENPTLVYVFSLMRMDAITSEVKDLHARTATAHLGTGGVVNHPRGKLKKTSCQSLLSLEIAPAYKLRHAYTMVVQLPSHQATSEAKCTHANQNPLPPPSLHPTRIRFISRIIVTVSLLLSDVVLSWPWRGIPQPYSHV
jgi:hypothetical protein